MRRRRTQSEGDERERRRPPLPRTRRRLRPRRGRRIRDRLRQGDLRRALLRGRRLGHRDGSLQDHEGAPPRHGPDALRNGERIRPGRRHLEHGRKQEDRRSHPRLLSARFNLRPGIHLLGLEEADGRGLRRHHVPHLRAVLRQGFEPRLRWSLRNGAARRPRDGEARLRQG